MQVLLINGSNHANGCTYTALRQVADVLEAEGISTEIVQLGAAPVRDCIACGGCTGKGRCVFTDDCVLDRAFYAGGAAFAHKPGFAVASARRAGTTASLDAVMKHFTINQMPVVSSTYWNMVHGNTPEEVLQDEEGLQTMRNAARNMAWLLKCIAAGKEQGILAPEAERGKRTNFIR